MTKKILYAVVLAMFIYWPAMAQSKYNSQDEAITGKASEEPDQPVVEPGQPPLQEDTTYSGTPVTPKYLSDEEVVTGEVPQPGEFDYIGTLREAPAPDDTLRSAPLPDAPLPDETLREVGVTESPEKDMNYRTTGLRESAGPDTIGREAPIEDSGTQEYASPYGPTPDIFAPKKKQ